MMSNAVRFTARSANQVHHSFALLLAVMTVISFGLAGCAGFVSGTNSNSTGSNPLTVSNVQPSGATPTGFQVNWTTNIAANSAVNYGTTSSYGSSTPLNSSMVTSHQVALSGLTKGTLYHFRVTSTDAQGVTANSGDMTFSTEADNTPPTVSITAPSANATLSGTTTLTASATDSVGIASVQFEVDNSNVGAPITSTPYSYSLNTATLSNGTHVINAFATDTVGNSATSAGVSVTVNNAAPAPSISSLNPPAGLVGSSVTISGANFGATQGSSTVKFNGTAATPTSWSATSIVTTVPASDHWQCSCYGWRRSEQRRDFHCHDYSAA